MYQPPFREIYLTEVSEVGLPIQKSKYAIRIVGEEEVSNSIRYKRTSRWMV